MNVAVVGGGQLGLMLGLAGEPLGIRCRFLDPAPDAPAGRIGKVLVGAYDDAELLARLVEGADATTYEFENFPADAAPPGVLPPPRALAVAQDRLAEKELCTSLGIATVPYAPAGSETELASALDLVGLPAVLKTRRLGYDGKGQVVVQTREDAAAAWSELGPAGLLVEAQVEFARELSILAVRGREGQTAFYPPIENVHRGGILRVSRAPAAPERRSDAEQIARRLLDELDYQGVLAVELFDTDDGLLVNELAPRVHNSGHWTIEGAETSQFENHLRAILGLPLGGARAVGASVMVNLIGGVPALERLLALPRAHVHVYGKEPRPGRKVGHVTLVDAPESGVDEAIALADAVAHDVRPVGA